MINWKTPGNGAWTDPTAWDSGTVPGPLDDVTIGVTGSYRVSLNASVSAHALTISDTGASLIVVDPGGVDAFGGDLVTAGLLGLDSDGYSSEGGSTVTVAGTLTETGVVSVGSFTGGLSAASLLSVGGLAGTGAIYIHGSTTAQIQATLAVAAAAPGTLAASISIDGDGLLQYGSGQIGAIAAGVTLLLNGTGARVADAGATATNSALTGLAAIAGTLQLINGGTIAIAGNVLETGAIDLDGDGYSGEGGSRLSIAGTLTNNGGLTIGPFTGGLSAATILSVAALAGTGGFSIHGSATVQAELDVAAAAPATLATSVTIDGDGLLQYGSGQIGTIAAGVTLLLNGTRARVADAGATATDSALTGLAAIAGTLQLVNGGTIAITGNVLETGAIDLDGDGYSGEGGSRLSIAGTLTNTGGLTIGPFTGGLSAATIMSVGGLAGTGAIYIHGSTSTATQAELDVAAAAPVTLTASTTIDGDGLLQYGSGQVGTIAAGVTLLLNGALARIADAGAATTNSALTGLAAIAGTLQIVNGNTVAIAGDVLETGAIDLDGDGYSSEGGSRLTIAGTLTDSGSLAIGPFTGGLSAATILSVAGLAGTGTIFIHGSTAAAIQAELDVAAAAPATLSGSVTIDGDGLLQFGSGQIGTIAAGVTLLLHGTKARVADAGAATTNSALTGLAAIAGTLQVVNGNTVAIAGNVVESGAIDLDGDGFSSEGGSRLSIGGTLTNNGGLTIGPFTGGLSAATILSVAALGGTGPVYIHGNTATATQAELDVAAAAPGTLTASTTIDGDGLLQYGSGQITAIAAGVTLSLSSAAARVADAGAATTSSALSGLTNIAGTLRVINGATVAIAGNVSETGGIDLDGDGFSGEGGSRLSIAGTLTNAGGLTIGPYFSGPATLTRLTVGALAGGGGISLFGLSYGTGQPAAQAELDVAAAAPSTLSSNLVLVGNTLLQYGGGQIGTIAANATVSLQTAFARIADVADPTHNSALAGLVALSGSLLLTQGASVAISNNLANAGQLGLDSQGDATEGGSSVTIAGTLTNSGQVTLGPNNGTQTGNDSLTVDALVNSGAIALYGTSATYHSTLLVRGAATSTGTVFIGANTTLGVTPGNAFVLAGGTLDLRGTLDAATVDIAGGTLELDGGTVTGGVVTLTGSTGTVMVASGAGTATAIAGFVQGDTIDFGGVQASQVTPTYSATTGLTTLAVTLTDSSVRNVNLVGNYAALSFAIGQSNGNATITTSAMPGNPASAVIAGNGGANVSGSFAANTVVLDLGVTTLNGPSLVGHFSVVNGGVAPSDLLGGSFSVSGPGVFGNTGLGAFASLAAGSADSAPTITLGSSELGTFTETIVLTPTDSNPNGAGTVLANETIDVTGRVVDPIPLEAEPPEETTSVVYGDVHLINFDGVAIDFQAAGEFVLSEATGVGDSFQVQARFAPYTRGSSVSVMTALAAEIGADRVAFTTAGLTIDGVATTIPQTGATIQLDGGTLRVANAITYVVNWNSGEQLTVRNDGSFLNVSLALSATEGAGSVRGLLGSDSGKATGFALADGTVLTQPLTAAQLYGEFANAWRVTQATSLLDYGPGQTTATFTDVNFPADALTLGNLPVAVVQNVAAQTVAAGITDPTISQAAQLDYAATGNAAFLTGAQFAQSVGVVPTQADIVTAAAAPALGIDPLTYSLAETQGGADTIVTFQIYLTAAQSHDTVVSWAVNAALGTLGPAAFGGTLPTGTAVIPTGATSTLVQVRVPASAFGTEPSDTLQVSIFATDPTPVFAASAQTVLLNPNPEAGPPAGVAITELNGGGVFTQNGTSYTLDLGTVQQGTGPITAQFGVANTGVVSADNLVGSLAVSGASAFTNLGLAVFGPVYAGASYDNTTVSLSTATTGTFTETVVLTAQDTNGTGYTAALPTRTLTITGTVANLPPPVISVLPTLADFYQMGTQLTPLSISDANAPDKPITVRVSASSGQLYTAYYGALAIPGNGSSSLSLTGKLADVNAALAALTYTGTALGLSTITVTATDADRATATQTITATTTPLPGTGARITTPVDTLKLGTASGLGGVQLIDPYDAATGTVLTLTLDSPDTVLSVKGPSGLGAADVTGQNSGEIVITGTVAQINAQLADDILADALTADALVPFLVSQALHQLNYFALTANLTGTGKFDTDLGPKDESLITVAGPEAKGFLIGVTFASFELNSIAAVAVGATPPSKEELIRDIIVILSDSHVVTPGGTLYSFDEAGEFVLAASTQPGDSFIVETRLQPLPGSTAASVMTQVAAQIGTDRVTFAVGRDSVVYVDGVATALSLSTPLSLSGGTLTQASADTYSLVWNTGETLTVIDDNSFLNVQVAAGPNNTESTLIGIDNISTVAGSDFTLPNGQILPQPLTPSALALFFNSYRVSDATSLFDYQPGQTTASFTDTTFPQTQIVLADLPADILAKAAAAVASVGLIDPGAVAAAEFDYVATGGNMAYLQADASLLAGRATTPAQITAGPAPVSIGVVPVQPTLRISQTAAAQVQFEAYLTAVATVDTVIDYSVVAAAGFLGAAAFGGTLPSGAITIAAGQTEGTITVTLPAGALGSDPQDSLELQVSSPAGTALFAPTAQITITQPVAGPPPAPEIVSLVHLGSFTHTGTSYVLDLGDVQYGEPLPDLIFGIGNAASAPSDMLGGTLSATTIDGFATSGIALPTALSAGQSYDGIDVAVQYTKFGPNAETITFQPTDTNATGVNNVLPTETLTIMDNVVAPTMVFSKAFGDVHIETYNGLLYDFQAVGEFTLAQSRMAGDSFDIQLRLSPFYNIINGAVSVITQVGLLLGNDKVTFDDARATTVYVDGAPSVISENAPVQNLAGGSITELSANVWKVVWNTGEEATITNWGNHIDVADGIPLGAPNTVGGLQGEDAGQADDFQLSDGTVLAQPLTYAQLYGPYADSWRITQAASNLDYGPGQTTATFTDRGYPDSYYAAQELPAAAQVQAAGLVAAAGITDAGLAADAVSDYLATGDTSFIAGVANVQQTLLSTTPVTLAALPTPVPQLGVMADIAGVTELATGTTPVTFDVYLTEPLTTAAVVPWTVVDGGAGFLGTAVFGATLPSGSVSLAAGQTEMSFTVQVPNAALGTAESSKLQVAITPPAGVPVIAPSAVATVENYHVEPGVAPVPVVSDLTTPANITAVGQSYTLDLGTFQQGQIVSAEQLAIGNDAASGADLLTGTATAPIGSGFTVIGANLTRALAAGDSYTGLYVTPQTGVAGAHTETFTLALKDVNGTGYTAALPTITVTILDTVAPVAQAALNSPETIVFTPVHVGDTDSRMVSVSNTAAKPAAALSLTPDTAGDATATGAVTQLAPGSTDATDITVGLGTAGAGGRTGTVTLDATSVMADGTSTPIALAKQINLFGAVYRMAAPTITVAAPSTILHVGDVGTVALDVSNTAATDGFSENLLATLASTSGGVTGTGQTGEIAAGASDSTSLTTQVSTAAAGIVSGTATVTLVSDGGTGADSLDGLGQTALAAQTMAVSVAVNNYAQAALGLGPVGSGATLTAGPSANSYVLNLGTVAYGSIFNAVSLNALNAATGPADGLTGSYTITGGSAFTNTGFAGFANLAAGSATTAGTIGLNTMQAGAQSETIVLHPTDTNATGFSQTQSDVTLTVNANVQSSGIAVGDVHLTSFDGVRFDFQAVGDYTLAKSSLAGDPFQIQVHTQADAFYKLASITTQAAAQVGNDVVAFNLDGSVTIDGTADTAISAAHPLQILDGGTLTALGADGYRLQWTGGESLLVQNAGIYLNLAADPGPAGAAAMQGLLGSTAGPIDTAQLAQQWAVGEGQLLLDGAALGVTNRMAFIQASAPGEILTGSLGSGNAAIEIAGTAANLAGSIVTDLAAGDVIDFTDLGGAAVSARWGSTGTLTVTDGTHSASLQIVGPSALAQIGLATDQHGGTLIRLG